MSAYWKVRGELACPWSRRCVNNRPKCELQSAHEGSNLWVFRCEHRLVGGSCRSQSTPRRVAFKPSITWWLPSWQGSCFYELQIKIVSSWAYTRIKEIFEEHVWIKIESKTACSFGWMKQAKHYSVVKEANYPSHYPFHRLRFSSYVPVHAISICPGTPSPLSPFLPLKDETHTPDVKYLFHPLLWELNWLSSRARAPLRK